MVARHGLASLRQADIIVLPGWRGVDAPVSAPLRKVLIAAHIRGARLASICSGALVLAVCGLLDGRRATTHWRYAEALQKAFPSINFDPDVLFVDEGNILTSAGFAAGLDLCIHVVRTDFGAEIANAVARRLVVPAIREGGQRQFVPRPVPRERTSSIAPLLDVVRSRLEESWSLELLAAEANMSIRNLSRKMSEATGVSTQKWLTHARVARAAELLETGTTLDDTVLACGFGSSESMRRHFRKIQGVSPSQYRSMYRVGADGGLNVSSRL